MVTAETLGETVAVTPFEPEGGGVGEGELDAPPPQETSAEERRTTTAANANVEPENNWNDDKSFPREGSIKYLSRCN
jgi:hypothetical protein